MNWKTCSLEAGAGISKRRHELSPKWLPSYSDTGMQKDELTMFAAACYSSLVPRVYPGLLYAAVFLWLCAQGLAVKL